MDGCLFSATVMAWVGQAITQRWQSEPFVRMQKSRKATMASGRVSDPPPVCGAVGSRGLSAIEHLACDLVDACENVFAGQQLNALKQRR